MKFRKKLTKNLQCCVPTLHLKIVGAFHPIMKGKLFSEILRIIKNLTYNMYYTKETREAGKYPYNITL